MIEIKLHNFLGAFADNKDIAQNIRTGTILPTLEGGGSVVLDFEGIESATQSFIHALISDLFRVYGDAVLERVVFKNCSETIQKVIGIVVDYMQES